MGLTRGGIFQHCLINVNVQDEKGGLCHNEMLALNKLDLMAPKKVWTEPYFTILGPKTEIGVIMSLAVDKGLAFVGSFLFCFMSLPLSDYTDLFIWQPK